jgi:hypothetical protein
MLSSSATLESSSMADMVQRLCPQLWKGRRMRDGKRNTNVRFYRLPHAMQRNHSINLDVRLEMPRNDDHEIQFDRGGGHASITRNTIRRKIK